MRKYTILFFACGLVYNLIHWAFVLKTTKINILCFLFVAASLIAFSLIKIGGMLAVFSIRPMLEKYNNKEKRVRFSKIAMYICLLAIIVEIITNKTMLISLVLGGAFLDEEVFSGITKKKPEVN
jgi:hypothetical protein